MDNKGFKAVKQCKLTFKAETIDY